MINFRKKNLKQILPPPPLWHHFVGDEYDNDNNLQEELETIRSKYYIIILLIFTMIMTIGGTGDSNSNLMKLIMTMMKIGPGPTKVGPT